MKLKICILSCIILFTCLSCNREGVLPKRGKASVLKNGQNWDVGVYASKDNSGKISIFMTEIIDRCIVGQLTIDNLTEQEGIVQLIPTSNHGDDLITARYKTLECDVILKNYYLKDSVNFEQKLIITKWKGRCISGEFQMLCSFVGNDNDTIKFTGTFDTKVIMR